jgi:hypothetical protein
VITGKDSVRIVPDNIQRIFMTLDEQINPMTRLKSQVPLHLAPFDVAVHFCSTGSSASLRLQP